MAMVRDKRRAAVRARAEAAAEERLLDALTGPGSTAARDSFRKKLRGGELDDKEVELQPGRHRRRHAGVRHPRPARRQMGMLNLCEMMGKAFGGRTKTHKTTVSGAWAPLIAEESDKLLDQEALTRRPWSWPRTTASCSSTRSTRSPRPARSGGADVSREGVQRDLLPLIEGTTVSTKYGPVKTDHILFIASAPSTWPSRRTCCRSCRAACRSAWS